MKIDLRKYLEERDHMHRSLLRDGPVLTVSRAYGCEANRLVRLLIHRINKLGPGALKKHPWKYISKEVIDECAFELGINPHDVDQRILAHSTDGINGLLAGFAHHYEVSDREILSKVKEVIINYAKRGNVILVGRGGSMVTEGMDNVLRIRLEAPLKWRARVIAGKLGIGDEAAYDLVQHMDENRVRWMEHLTGRTYNEHMFDLVINVEKMSDKETLDVILQVMKHRGMIPSQPLEGKSQKFKVS